MNRPELWGKPQGLVDYNVGSVFVLHSQQHPDWVERRGVKETWEKAIILKVINPLNQEGYKDGGGGVGHRSLKWGAAEDQSRLG